MAGMTGNEGTHKLAGGTQRPGLQLKQDMDQRGIVIQLTDTEGEWDNLDDTDLIFTLDCDGKKSLSSLRNQRPCSVDIQTEGEWGLSSPAFNVPLSPSSPGSLRNSFPPGSGFLSPTHRPLASLVKSLSTELELKESSLKPKPLLSLVKSISTELSRSEPEVSQSRSDSKLNLHLLSQFTQPKSRNGDSRTAPPSPVSLSPTEPKASFFKMELEDTRRKLSEAMQEPLSMFSKIMREDSVGSPKHQRSTGSVDSPSYKGFGIVKTTTDLTVSESPKSARKAESEILPECNWPVRHRKRCVQKSSLSHEHHSRQVDTGPVMESSTHGSASQSTDMNRTDQDGLAEDVTEQCSSPVPGVGLAFVAFLSYCYFIFPLSAYWSGLFLGLGFGLMLGLVMIRWSSMKHFPTSQQHGLHGTSYNNILFEALQSNVPSLKGWMNEMYAYDPETYYPSLMHTVYVTLDGPCLRLDYPRNNIPRWATFDEPCYEKHFTHSRIFRLTGSKVFLLPLALAHKRVWNRKYPICISLAEGERAVEEDEMAEGQGEAQKVEKHPGPTTNVSHRVTLYLFGRTGREKEEWFHRLFSASIHNEENHSESISDKSALHEENPWGLLHGDESSVKDSSEDVFHSDLVGRVKENILPDYTSYMTSLIFSAHASPLQSPCQSSTQGSPTDKEQTFCCHEDETKPDWLNALIGRIFWDFLHEKYWADKVQQKIQRKLSKIRLPYFMDELTLTELAMGSSMPQITGTSLPQVNSRGLWLHLEVEYTGALQMTLETKINLSKLGKEGVPEAEAELETINVFSRSRLSVLADSDEESSSAGSSDEEEVSSADTQGSLIEKAVPGVEGAAAGGSTSRRILRFVDKIAKSKYFQKATENEYIKKKIEEMSNIPLLLAVEVQELSGTLAINVPPPPTDRIWYSFCGPPKLDLRVRPKLGEREVTFCHVTEWIEKKLQDEFQKVFVLPNMDDIYLPLMHSGMDNPLAFPQYPAKLSQHSSMASTDRCDLERSAELQ
ncbi:testis-expressed sequence 2 protein-like isoform X2 [Sinocyclocheilus rhinocerous]|uniref:testis-expressed sequence 2 protein-like isoform X2 n=1 Tax=Sinocyclocheilus rhinocerous TaxID=307959 RepID=UPI0007BA8867|nr:PREDICTED: testis-expressed sequence 2 protein-like isoform X2 [Sinocyclocheilus rhinocerous]